MSFRHYLSLIMFFSSVSLMGAGQIEDDWDDFRLHQMLLGEAARFGGVIAGLAPELKEERDEWVEQEIVEHKARLIEEVKAEIDEALSHEKFSTACHLLERPEAEGLEGMVLDHSAFKEWREKRRESLNEEDWMELSELWDIEKMRSARARWDRWSDGGQRLKDELRKEWNEKHPDAFENPFTQMTSELGRKVDAQISSGLIYKVAENKYGRL